MRRVHQHNGGFHLLEITAAIFVLTAGAFGVVTTLQQGLSHIRETQEQLIATQAVRNEIETARAELKGDLIQSPFVSVSNHYGRNTTRDFAKDAPGLDRLHNAMGTVQIRSREDLGPGVHEIQATLRWTGNNGRTMEKSLTTLTGVRRLRP